VKLGLLNILITVLTVAHAVLMATVNSLVK